MVLFRTSFFLSWGGSISTDSFLSSILLLVVIIVTVVIVVVILIVAVVAIVGVVIVVVIIREVVVFGDVSSVLKLLFVIIGLSVFAMVAAYASQAAAIPSAISCQMALDDKLGYPLMIISRDEYLTHSVPQELVYFPVVMLSGPRLVIENSVCSKEMIRCRNEVEEAVRMISSTYSSKILKGMERRLRNRGGGGRGGGGVVSGVDDVCGDGVDSGVRGVDCEFVCGVVYAGVC
nr:hypothetical protein [Tanacetum cinerariifolium]